MNNQNTPQKFELVEIKQETPDIKTFLFEPLSVDGFTWQAGQYLDWQLPHPNADDRGERRWFSISTAPSEGLVGLSCRFSDDGSTLKKHLLSLEVGAVVEAIGPHGEFTLPKIDGPTVMIAGGIGITPFRSIIKELASSNNLNDVHLIYGNRAPENVAFLDEMVKLEEVNPSFKLTATFNPVIINAELVESVTGGLFGKVYMISGLEKMVESIKHSLIEAGVEESAVRIDDFGGYDWHLDKPVF
jgi:glycine betaine catabolism B